MPRDFATVLIMVRLPDPELPLMRKLGNGLKFSLNGWSPVKYGATDPYNFSQ